MTGPPTDIVVDTLRLRGAHGRRLARVAARALPAALERALADVGDVEVGELHVVLDLDPEEYDDETLALLWADLIRASLLARPTQTTAPTRSSHALGAALPTEGPSVDPVAIARAWLSLPEPDRVAVPAALLLLGDHTRAVRVAAELGPTDWRLLVAALRRVLPGLDASGGAVATSAGGEPPAGPVAASGATDPAAVPAPTDVPSAAGDGRPPTGTSDEAAAAEVARAADVLAAVDTLRELHTRALTPLDPAAVTRVAGLVLLYPWLADHCRLAEELHPGLDPHDVREAALAAVVADPSVADDPLVRILAGRPEPWTDPPRDRVELTRQEEVDRSAERVVESFAALLPGFERSTPGFVRDAWLLRLGVLDVERAPMLLTAATHPLDVLLPLLPYPMGLFKLPWSPALTVRFRP